MNEHLNFGFPGMEARAHISGTTNGQETRIDLKSNGIHFSQADRLHPVFLLRRPELEFVNVLMKDPDTPYLASHLLEKKELTSDEPISDRYQRLMELVPREHELQTHFIKFGNGSATWYGFLSNNQDPSLLIARGRHLIKSEGAYKADRREKAFTALEKLYGKKYGASNDQGDVEEDDSLEISNKLILGAGAITVIAVGCFVTYVRHKHTVR